MKFFGKFFLAVIFCIGGFWGQADKAPSQIYGSGLKKPLNPTSTTLEGPTYKRVKAIPKNNNSIKKQISNTVQNHIKKQLYNKTPSLIKHQIQQKIQSKKLSKKSLGIVISTLNNSLPLYTLNQNKRFIPASLAKIPSLLALYDLYPQSYTFKTVFASSAPIQNGVLKGDLVLMGGGDSSFTSESLWKLVNILTRSGVQKITGRLLIDDRLYKKAPALPYSERSYLAPSSASSFNWNSVAFYIRPAKKLHQKAVIYANPQNSYIQVINQLKTGTKTQITIKRQSVLADKELFLAQGTISKDSLEKAFYRNITNPPLWLGFNALSFLRQRGIVVSGGVQKGSCWGDFAFDWPLQPPLTPPYQGGRRKPKILKESPFPESRLAFPTKISTNSPNQGLNQGPDKGQEKPTNCRLLAEWDSRPLSFHFYNMMKYSSNFVTRMLVSHIPLLQGQSQGDLKRGMEQVQKKLQQRGLKNFKLVEPSGLDRKNRFPPLTLHTALLQLEDQNHSPELLASYPVAQGEGTLKNRFKDSSGFVRAKTGSLHGVLGLAGWVKNHEKSYRFVFIYNGPNKKTGQAQELFDEIVQLLSQK